MSSAASAPAASALNRAGFTWTPGWQPNLRIQWLDNDVTQPNTMANYNFHGCESLRSTALPLMKLMIVPLVRVLFSGLAATTTRSWLATGLCRCRRAMCFNTVLMPLPRTSLSCGAAILGSVLASGSAAGRTHRVTRPAVRTSASFSATLSSTHLSYQRVYRVSEWMPRAIACLWLRITCALYDEQGSRHDKPQSVFKSH
jgi:hypothetical protein